MKATKLAVFGAFLIAVSVIGAVSIHYLSPRADEAKEWKDAFNPNEQEYNTFSFEKSTQPIDATKSPSIHFSPTCDHWDTYKYQKYCENGKNKEREDRVASAEYLVKTEGSKEAAIEHMNQVLPKIAKNENGVDLPYLVWSFKQIAFDMGAAPAAIKNPHDTILDNYAMWHTNDYSQLSVLACGLIGLLFFIPLLWVGLWRVIGIAVKSAKKEMKG
ncbi:hypothetical protein PYR66_09970 [Klebsiella aerogenes]|nr:hypothetical protein PYR66_09970 [Klebsiella aerogenes]